MILEKILSLPMSRFRKKVSLWLTTSYLGSKLFKGLQRALIHTLSDHGKVILSYNKGHDPGAIAIIRKLRVGNQMLLGENEAYQLFMAVKATGKVHGDIAELGVFKGGSAALICEAKGNKTLHALDTFEGIPDTCEFDWLFTKGQFRASLETTRDVLNAYPNVHIYKGVFPQTARALRSTTFSFVNIDADLYRTTIDGLHFFYPRMEAGGIIMCHDYGLAEGVRRAVDEFFTDKPECVLPLTGSYCMIVRWQKSNDGRPE